MTLCVGRQGAASCAVAKVHNCREKWGGTGILVRPQEETTRKVAYLEPGRCCRLAKKCKEVCV